MTANTKAYLVTGANRGVGLAVVRALVSQPGRLVFLTARQFDSARKAAASLEPVDGSEAIPLQLDVVSDDSIERAVKEVQEHLSKRELQNGLAGLVNNAGINLEFDYYIKGSVPPFDVKPSEIRTALSDTFSVNVFSVAAVTAGFLPLLKAYKPGKAVVVNLSSSMGSITMHTDPAARTYDVHTVGYSTSKSALNALTVYYSRTQPSLRFVALHPGFLGTDLTGYLPQTKNVNIGAQFLVDELLNENGETGIFVSPNETFEKTERLPW